MSIQAILTGKQFTNVEANPILAGTETNLTALQVGNTKYSVSESLSFTITLAVASWNNNMQTISNANLIANGYSYIISAASSSFKDYVSAGIYAEDVISNGSITFHCDTTPSSAIMVNILRITG